MMEKHSRIGEFARRRTDEESKRRRDVDLKKQETLRRKRLSQVSRLFRARD